jgi:HEAT repeat protein
MKKIIADYMEKGFLENIIDMFKHDRSLFALIADLMADERGRVRLGTVVLVEALKQDYYDEIVRSVPAIAGLLQNPNPTIRGDAAYLLGVIGHVDALPFLSEALSNGERNEIVKETIQESITYLTHILSTEKHY